MSKPRLTKEQKKLRKELIKYHRSLPSNKAARRRERRAAVFAVAFALLIQALVKRKD